MSQDKPFKSWTEQRDLLESRGIKVDGETIDSLHREGYYSVINGYKSFFLKNAEQEEYLENTSFNAIHALFVLDRSLRMAFLKALIQSETTIQTVVAYHFSQSYLEDPQAYLNPSLFRNPPQYSPAINEREPVAELIGVFEARVKQYGSRRGHPLYHYVNEHTHIPLWVAIKYLTFGEVARFYGLIASENLKNTIARDIGVMSKNEHTDQPRGYLSHTELTQVLRLQYKFRNICAHDERFYCHKEETARNATPYQLFGSLRWTLTKNEHVALSQAIRSAFTDFITISPHPISYTKVLSEMGFPVDFV